MRQDGVMSSILKLLREYPEDGGGSHEFCCMEEAGPMDK